MPALAVGLVFDLLELVLNSPAVYNALQAKVAAEGRSVTLDDVRALQAELRNKQVELDGLIAAMPDD